MDMGVRSWMAFGIICGMRQLELFTRTELAGMRDRSRARNYCASRDEFRRAHERHREWGLQRRHAERLRQIREREAGCWPVDLEVLHAGVEEGRSGMADLLPPGTGRPPRAVRRPAPGCHPRAGSVGQAASLERVGSVGRAGFVGRSEPARQARHASQAGSARRAGPAGKPHCEPESTSPPQPCSAESNRGRRAAPALSTCRHPAVTTRRGEERVDDSTPRPLASPPRPGRVGERQSGPTRPAATRHAPKPAAGATNSTTRTPKRKAVLTLLENELNPRLPPRQYRQRIPP